MYDSEQDLLEQIFGEVGPQGPVQPPRPITVNERSYVETYCRQCETFSIAGCSTPDCHGSSCNGGGCNICVPDHLAYQKSPERRKSRFE